MQRHVVTLSVFTLAVPFSAHVIAADWTSLFNGKNLDGWVVKCRPEDKDKNYWKVVDGTITAETPPGSKHNYIWLLTEKEYSDFEMRLKVQSYSTSTGNSGIQVRSRDPFQGHHGAVDGVVFCCRASLSSIILCPQTPRHLDPRPAYRTVCRR